MPGVTKQKDDDAYDEDLVDGRTNRRVVIRNDITQPIPTTLVGGNVTVLGDSKISGTVDGTDSGTERTFVNNRKHQVLAAHDVVKAHTWADFGLKTERLLSTVYTSATFPGITVTHNFVYTLVGTKYRLDSDTWVTAPGG